MLGSYRRDMQRAWNRIRAVPTQRLQTRFGMVEYAQRGDGLPLLNCHGVLGCHADGVAGWWANMLGEGFRVISPARFGYFGSTLQPTATPADQADTYTLLLDDLGIDRVAAVSELQFPLRPRKAGALFDGFVSNLVADRFPLERLAVPTLVVSAVDDHRAPYSYAAMAAERIPGAKLVTIDQGGHLFLSHDTQVHTAIAAFIAAVTQPKGEGR